MSSLLVYSDNSSITTSQSTTSRRNSTVSFIPTSLVKVEHRREFISLYISISDESPTAVFRRLLLARDGPLCS